MQNSNVLNKLKIFLLSMMAIAIVLTTNTSAEDGGDVHSPDSSIPDERMVISPINGAPVIIEFDKKIGNILIYRDKLQTAPPNDKMCKQFPDTCTFIIN